jgi:hypothetical protein
MITSSFVVPTGVTSCMVSSDVQTQPAAGAPAGTVFFRNAVSRNSVTADDGAYGHYLYNDGTTKKQPDMSRTSVFTVTAGQTTQFGVFFGDLNVSAAWLSQPYAAATSYFCS